MTEPIRFIVPVALREVMDHLLPAYTRETGHRFAITTMLNPQVPEAIAVGADWSVAISNPNYIAQIETNNARTLGHSPLAFGRLGATDAPAARSNAELTDLLMGADAIALTKSGTSGAMLHRLAADLGIADAIRPKLRALGGGEPMRALLAGEVDLAALPLSNIAPVDGVATPGICPLGLGVHIDLTLCTNPNASLATRAFADWLLDPARDEALAPRGVRRNA